MMRNGGSLEPLNIEIKFIRTARSVYVDEASIQPEEIPEE